MWFLLHFYPVCLFLLHCRFLGVWGIFVCLFKFYFPGIINTSRFRIQLFHVVSGLCSIHWWDMNYKFGYLMYYFTWTFALLFLFSCWNLTGFLSVLFSVWMVNSFQEKVMQLNSGVVTHSLLMAICPRTVWASFFCPFLELPVFSGSNLVIRSFVFRAFDFMQTYILFMYYTYIILYKNRCIFSFCCLANDSFTVFREPALGSPLVQETVLENELKSCVWGEVQTSVSVCQYIGDYCSWSKNSNQIYFLCSWSSEYLQHMGC